MSVQGQGIHAADAAVRADLDAFLEEQIRRQVFPGATVAFGRSDGPVATGAYGHLTYDGDDPVTFETRYDLASLTKVVATATAILRLVEDGVLGLDDPAALHLPAFGRAGKERVTIRHLLTHSGGVVPYPGCPVERLTTAEALLDAIFDAPTLYPPGTEARYSEVGFIVLGELVARVAGAPFATVVRERILDPLGMRYAGFFGDGDPAAREVAPTGFDDRFRGRRVRGEVHEPMTAALGGTSGSAGLFGAAPDLVAFARMILRRGVADGRRFLREETVRTSTVPSDPSVTDTRALGWDTRSPRGYTVAGRFFGLRSFGHTGDTGASLWIDPDADLFVILLSNRTEPTRHNRSHLHVRPVVSDFAWRAVFGPTPPAERGTPRRTPVA